MTSLPESLRSFGIGWFDFHGYYEGWMIAEPEVRNIFTLQVQGNSFLQVTNRLIKRLALRDDCDLHAFGDKTRLFARADNGLDCVL